MIKPSKELLTAVLGTEIEDCIIEDNTIWPLEFHSWRKGEMQLCNCKNHPRGINIYELMHMLKEWARTKKLTLLASSSNGVCEFVHKNIDATYSSDEPGAVVKACEELLK